MAHTNLIVYKKKLVWDCYLIALPYSVLVWVSGNIALLVWVSGNMAAGGHGIVIFFGFWRVIVCNLCPSSETFSDNKWCLNVLSEERCNVISIGYGRNIIFSLLHLHSSRPSISKHHSNAGKFIITLCLLLSGDIHPCPGPNGEVCPGFNKGRVLDSGSYLAERNSRCCTGMSVMQWQGSKY